MNGGKTHTPFALLATAPGTAPPESFQALWERAGFRAGRDSRGADRRAGEPVFSVRWVGTDWEDGLRWLETLPEERRDAALLVGEGALPVDLVARVRRTGGWAAAPWPVPEWMVRAALGAVERSRTSLAAALTKTLRALEPELEKAPEAILVRTAELAGELLGSDLALPVIGTSDSTWVLQREGDGFPLEAWRRTAERLELPAALPQLLATPGSGQTRSILAFATPAHLPEAIRPAGPVPYQATVCLPVRAQQGGIAGQPKPLLAALFLFWRTPHLPRMGELLPLKILRGFAATALTRLAERARLTNRHIVAIRAQSEYFGVPDFGEPGPSLAHERDILPRILRAYAGLPGLQEVWAQVAASSRGSSPWYGLGAAAGAEEPPAGLGEGFTETRFVDLQGGSGPCALCRLVDRDRPETGRVVAVFASRDLALAGRAEIESLAADLELAARLLRRERVNASLAELSSADIRPEDPRSEFLRIAEEVQSSMAADGAKIFVLRREGGERKIWQVCNTAAREQEPGMVAFRPGGPGLANRVLKEGKWLLIPDRDPRRPGSLAEKVLIGGVWDEVMAVPESNFFQAGKAPKDDERTMLWVPLRSQGKVSGVIAVWRVEPQPFDDELDVESLTRFAPHVAAACQRLLQVEKAREELQTTASLAKKLDSSQSFEQIHLAIADGAGRLADAALALLFQYDTQADCLSLSAAWTAEGDGEALRSRLGRLLLDNAGGVETWEEKVRASLRNELAELSLRTLVLSGGETPTLALALLDTAPPQETLFFSDDLLDHFTRSFLESAAALLKSQVPALASRLIDQVGDPGPGRKAPEVLLRDTADLLRTALGAEAVLYYTGTSAPMQIQGAIPKVGELGRFDVLRDSETARSLQEKAPRRFLDVTRQAPAGVHRQRLDDLARSFGWRTVGSWLSCPVIYDGRCRGLIKLLTSGQGPFFGADHERVARIVTERAGLEMYKASRRMILEDLLEISGDIAAGPPETHGEPIVQKLQAWLGKRWMRPDATVAVVARAQGGKGLALASAPPLPGDGLKELEKLSETWGSSRQSWSGLPPCAAGEMPEVFCRHGLAEPFQNPGMQLKGHLVLLDDEPFTAEDQEAWRLTSADMAVLLNGERERLEEREKMGRFRHAALGPIQGLTSSAKLLAQLAEESGLKTPLLAKLQQRVAAEAENLRLWREHQRFYLSREVEIRPVWQRLRPVVESCIERFRPILRDRNIDLNFEWRAPHSLHCLFDEKALDLVLANLLDNACKYAFFNRDVEVGVRTSETRAIFWVEDIGHGIPDDQKDEIYQLGKRARRHDPYRPIPGEGLGLAMSKAIVQAHGGRIYHVSRPETHSARRDEKTPFLVRFTVELPLSGGGEPSR